MGDGEGRGVDCAEEKRRQEGEMTGFFFGAAVAFFVSATAILLAGRRK